jgi:hypothetical protein
LQALESSKQLSIHGTSFYQHHNSKGKIVMIKTSGYKGLFLVFEIGIIFGDRCGAHMGFAWRERKLPDDPSFLLRT